MIIVKYQAPNEQMKNRYKMIIGVTDYNNLATITKVARLADIMH